MSHLHNQHRRSKQQKRQKTATLNLVSLMDIFTILVFFLMVNSSEVEVLQTSSKIKLPDSSSEKRPENQLTITVGDDAIVVQGRAVAQISTLDSQEATVIGGLEQELIYHAQKKTEIPEGGHEITIMGDRELPYWLLKKIMLTCQSADYARISLAVNKVEGADSLLQPSPAEDSVAQAAAPAGAAS